MPKTRVTAVCLHPEKRWIWLLAVAGALVLPHTNAQAQALPGARIEDRLSLYGGFLPPGGFPPHSGAPLGGYTPWGYQGGEAGWLKLHYSGGYVVFDRSYSFGQEVIGGSRFLVTSYFPQKYDARPLEYGRGSWNSYGSAREPPGGHLETAVSHRQTGASMTRRRGPIFVLYHHPGTDTSWRREAWHGHTASGFADSSENGRGVGARLLAWCLVFCLPPLQDQANGQEKTTEGGIRPARDVLASQVPAPDATPSYREASPLEVLAPPGYRVELFATSLHFPSDITFSDEGDAYIAESGFHGFSNDPLRSPPPQIIQIRPDRTRSVVYERTVSTDDIRNARTVDQVPEGIIPPIMGITWHKGKIYIAHRGRYSVLDPEDPDPRTKFKTIINGLPCWGPSINGKPIFDRDGKMVFFVPTQSNTGIVDEDMCQHVLIYNKLQAHDIPGEDVVLTGASFSVPLDRANRGEPFMYAPDELVAIDLQRPFMPPIPYTHINNLVAPGENARTGAYLPLWTESRAGQVIKGQKICNGAFFRCNPDGSDLQRIAWGFHTSGGYRVAPDGRLYCTEAGVGPSRPRGFWFDSASIKEVVAGDWYGWPDFFGGLPVTDARFHEGGDRPRFLLTEDTHRRLLKGQDRPRPPLVRLPPHSAPQGMVFGRPEFGLDAREVLVAEMGSIEPFFKGDQLVWTAADREERYFIQQHMPTNIPPDAELHWPGFKVQRINLDTGERANFLVNELPGPSTAWRGRGLERPLQLEWGPDGALYVVDIGTITVRQQEKDWTMNAHVGTGVIWRILREVPDRRPAGQPFASSQAAE